MQTVIKVENLSKKFRIGKLRGDEGTLRDLVGNIIKFPFNKRVKNPEAETLWALKDINFEVYQGDTLGIVGGNGAGKSTLLKILSRIIKPTTGRAKLGGRVGSLLEVGTGFHQDLTGRENVFLNGAVLGMRRREIEKKFDEIVAFAEIERFIDTPVKFYSTGMYLRLAFAVAAHLEPDILIVDEVLAVGDAAFQAKCLGRMGEVVGSGRTILFVSHSSMMVEKLCRTALYLKNGKLEDYGATKPILAQYEADYELNWATEAVSRNLLEIEDDEIRFIKWSISNSATHQPHTIVSREKAEFEFQLVCRQQTANLRFNFAIQDQEGRPLIVASSVSADKAAVAVEEGTHRLRWTCYLPLQAGFYRLVAEVASADDDTLLDTWRCQPELEILPSPDEFIGGQLQGLINIPVKFDLARDVSSR